MGLSRPGVESTLFRARKRLTEEYDELVSGERCVRIQSIIASSASAVPGARDSRRLARHLSHCQPCRRHAAAAGLDVAALARKPLRRRVAERIGGLLPLPGFLRSRLWPAGEHLAAVSEPMSAGWSKAAAVVATLVVVGAGTGSVPHKADGTPAPQKPSAAPAAATSGSGAAASPARARALGVTAKPTRTTTRQPGTRKKKASRQGSGAAPGGNTRAGGGAGSSPASPSSPTTPAAAKGDGSGSTPTRKPSGGRKTPRLPSANVPAATKPVGDAVDKTVQDTTQAVNDTVGGVTDTVNDVTDTVGGAVNNVGNTAGGAVGGGVGGAVGGAVEGATGAAGGAVGGVTGAAGGAVGGVTGAAGGAVDDVTDALPDLGGG